MPVVTIEHEGERTIEVETGTRLVQAIERAGVEIGHRCGGHAKCTTCRVEFLEGEPDRMTEAEATRLETNELTGVRLSCQVPVERDMKVLPVMVLGEQPWDDAGPAPEARITPEPIWVAKRAGTPG